MSDNNDDNLEKEIEEMIEGEISSKEEISVDLPKDVSDNYDDVEVVSNEDIDDILNDVVTSEIDSDSISEESASEDISGEDADDIVAEALADAVGGGEEVEEAPKKEMVDAEGNPIDQDLADLWGSAMEEQGSAEEVDDDLFDSSSTSVGSEDEYSEEIVTSIEEKELSAEERFKKGNVVHGDEAKSVKVSPAQLSESLGGDINLDIWRDIPVTVSLEIGRTRIPIRNVLHLNQGSIVELDKLAGEYLDVLVNGTLIAHGEVVVVNDNFGIRLTDVVSVKERIEKIKE